VIGVLSKDNEGRAVAEFFQLFKTPWEFWAPNKKYDLVVASGGEIPKNLSAAALVIYQSQSIPFDGQMGVMPESRKKGAWVEWRGVKFPLYGDVMGFQSSGSPLIGVEQTSDIVASVDAGLERPTARIGFDLFSEVAFLLSEGQPAENARFPTLDIHISLLRSIMVTLGVPFVEVPPVPHGFDFMACLTHDVDFVGIRDHKCDHTMWGFLYRSTVGSFLKALAGKLSWSKLVQNWAAAMSLPLVHLGLREDFWLEFDRYTEIEKKFGSTFFFLPFKDAPGTLGQTPAPPHRAAKYDVVAIKKQVAELMHDGCEVGLHGIDAWQSVQSAQSEQGRIREVTGQADVGIRMHWLYWKESSPTILEEAGFTYDSTFGYNDAVGFRAGTTQPFRPLNAEHLLELPLNIQDSALFYRDRMMLSETEAMGACKELIETMSSSGGALTVNWHTRSLSPERLWGEFYAELLEEIQKRRVWFGTAQDIVAWFRKRRALRFDSVQFEENGLRVSMSSPDGPPDQPFTLRIHHRRFASGQAEGLSYGLTHKDTQWSGEAALEYLMD
jgi:hypothetical protein